MVVSYHASVDADRHENATQRGRRYGVDLGLGSRTLQLALTGRRPLEIGSDDEVAAPENYFIAEAAPAGRLRDAPLLMRFSVGRRDIVGFQPTPAVRGPRLSYIAVVKHASGLARGFLFHVKHLKAYVSRETFIATLGGWSYITAPHPPVAELRCRG